MAAQLPGALHQAVDLASPGLDKRSRFRRYRFFKR